MPLRLLATDLDGTLLRSDATVSAHTVRAIQALRESGVLVLPVTARQPEMMRPLVEPAGLTEWSICSNGAFAVHLTTGELAYAVTLSPAVQAELVGRLSTVAEDVRFATIRDLGRTFCAQPGYLTLMTAGDHGRDPRTIHPVDNLALVAEPCVKLVLRQPNTDPAETLELVNALGIEGISATRSGAPFVEVSAAGVDKGSGLARLCDRLGIAAADTVAVGDAPNDLPMLSWAGLGVAMGNAEPEVKARADLVLPGDNDSSAFGDFVAELGDNRS